MSAPKSYTWISLWFLFSYTIVFWDLVYILVRPHSLAGGKFRWIWSVYDELELFDKTYFPEYFYAGHLKSTALSAKGALSIPEVGLAVVYLYKAHISKSSSAPIYGFTAAVATALKCALWTLEELYCGWCTTGHNTNSEIFASWTFPTAVWTILSLMAAWRFGKDMGQALKREPRAVKANEKGLN